MKEIKFVKQIKGESFRRWFQDEQFDLIVWLSEKSEISSFQLVYRDRLKTKAISWKENSGFFHHDVDEGETKPGKPKMSPILFLDGEFSKSIIIPLFIDASKEIDPYVSSFIIDKLNNF